jgi:DinB superfamily
MIDLTHDRSTVLSDYLAAPDRLAQVIAGLDKVSLDCAVDATSWTIRQLVHHIADGDDLWNIAVKAAIGNPGGVFTLQWYWDVPQTTWAEQWHYADRDVPPSLELFKANRRHIAQLLAVVPEAWDRAITISSCGHDDDRASVAEIVAMQARHALGHIEEIAVILSKERQAH